MTNTEKDAFIDELIAEINSYEERNPLAQLNASGVKILLAQHKSKK